MLKKYLLLVGMLVLICGQVFAGDPGSEEKPVQEVIETPAAAPVPSAVAPAAPEAAPEMAPAPAATSSANPCTVTCYRPVWKTRDVVCQRKVCKFREETRTCQVPKWVPQKQTRTITCYRTEYEEVMQTVTRCVMTVDECGRCCPQMVTCEVPCKVPKCVPYEVEQEYCVMTCQMETREYTVKVPYWETEEYTVQQKYCEMEPYEVEVKCCVPCCVPCNPCCNPC